MVNDNSICDGCGKIAIKCECRKLFPNEIKSNKIVNIKCADGNVMITEKQNNLLADYMKLYGNTFNEVTMNDINRVLYYLTGP